MSKSVMLVVFVLFAACSIGFSRGDCEPLDPQAKERAFYEQARLLKDNIQKGWTPEQVSRIMGLPERKTTSTQGSDTVEVWGYEGYDVRIEFHNGLAEKWFFRFMQ